MLQFQLFAPKTINDYQKCQLNVCRDVKLLKRTNKMIWFIALTHHCSIIDVYSHARTNDKRDIKIHLFRGMNCVNWICNCLLTPHSTFWSSRINYLNKSPEIIWRLISECFKVGENFWSGIDAKFKFAFQVEKQTVWQLKPFVFAGINFNFSFLLRPSFLQAKSMFHFPQLLSISDNLLSINNNIMIVKYLSQTNQIFSRTYFIQ